MARGRGGVERGAGAMRRSESAVVQAWQPRPTGLTLDEWRQEARRAAEDPGAFGAPSGDGPAEEILIPLRLEDHDAFIDMYYPRTADAGGETRIRDITFGRAPLPGEGTELFALLRIPTHCGDGQDRFITAVIPLDEDVDDLMNDDDEAYASINTALFDLIDMTPGSVAIMSVGNGLVNMRSQRQRVDIPVDFTSGPTRRPAHPDR